MSSSESQAKYLVPYLWMMLNATLFSAEWLVVLLVLICVYIIARKQLLSRGVMQDDSGVYDTATSSLGTSSHGGSPKINVEVFSFPV